MNIRRDKTTTRQNRSQSTAQRGMNSDLHELFLEELADMYDAEHQLTKALPKMAKAAKFGELRQAFQSHLEETQNHISRLERVAESLGQSLKRQKCPGMQGLIEEGEDLMDEKEDSDALDAALIISAQKVEHYEIAAYGSLCEWAELMGHSEALDLLQETLSEEKQADEKLTDVARQCANLEARQE